MAANKDIVGEVFNVGGGSRISVNELIKMVEEITGKIAKIKYVEKQKGDVRDTLADTSKMKALRWKPKVKLEAGLTRFTKWYKN